MKGKAVHTLPFLATFAALLGGQYALADEAPPFLVDLSACLALDGDSAREACYLQRIQDALPANTEGVAPGLVSGEPDLVADVPGLAASEAGEVEEAEDTGRGVEAGEDAPVVADAVVEDETAEPAAEEPEPAGEVLARISALRETVPNQHLITLDNGQVWRQVRSDRYPLREGQSVRLEPSRWGDTYRLSAEEVRGVTQVERLR